MEIDECYSLLLHELVLLYMLDKRAVCDGLMLQSASAPDGITFDESRPRRTVIHGSAFFLSLYVVGERNR